MKMKEVRTEILDLIMTKFKCVGSARIEYEDGDYYIHINSHKDNPFNRVFLEKLGKHDLRIAHFPGIPLMYIFIVPEDKLVLFRNILGLRYSYEN